MNEIWKDVKDYEGLYQISSFGRQRNRRGKILKFTKYGGYYVAQLCKNNKRHFYTVHRLVAAHFILNPENKCQINHIDGDKFNNNVENLEWCTARENSIHSWKNKLQSPQKGEEHSQHKLTEIQIKEIRNKYVPRIYSQYKLAKEYNVSQGLIGLILRREIWKHI